MRLIAATMLLASLVVLPALPTAAADCRISVRDPTNPYITEDCTDLDEVRDIVNGTSTITADAAGDHIVAEVDHYTGICDTEVSCTEVLDARVTVSTDTTEPADPLTVVVDGSLAGMDQQQEIDTEECELDDPDPAVFIQPEPCLISGS